MTKNNNWFIKEANCFLTDSEGNISKSTIKKYHLPFAKIKDEADYDGFLNDDDFLEVQIIDVLYSNHSPMPSFFKILYEEFYKMGKPEKLILREGKIWI